MPIGHIVRNPAIDAENLQRILTKEWDKPSKEAEPVLIEESAGSGDYKRLYVVWSLWSGVSNRQRSEIILHAYKDTHPLEDVLNVTIAMGFTPDEANGMGISWNIEP